MEDEKKVDWYPGMKEAEPKDWFPSMSGTGDDPIEFFRPQTPQEVKQGAARYTDSMRVKELPRFLIDTFITSAQAATLPEVYPYYIGEIERAKCLDDKTIAALRKYESEVKKAGTSSKRQAEALNPLIEYLGQLKMERREL